MDLFQIIFYIAAIIGFVVITAIILSPGHGSSTTSSNEPTVVLDPKDGSTGINIGNGMMIDNDGSGIHFQY